MGVLPRRARLGVDVKMMGRLCPVVSAPPRAARAQCQLYRPTMFLQAQDWLETVDPVGVAASVALQSKQEGPVKLTYFTEHQKNEDDAKTESHEHLEEGGHDCDCGP
jgi:hypothetical protein